MEFVVMAFALVIPTICIIFPVFCDFAGWEWAEPKHYISIGVVVALYVSFAVMFFQPHEKDVVLYSEAIVNLKDASEIEGGGSILAVHIGEEMKYRYYTRNTDGSFSYREIEAYGTRIKYGEPARVDYVGNRYEKFKWMHNWCLCDGKKIIVVPEGTIVETYEIDME